MTDAQSQHGESLAQRLREGDWSAIESVYEAHVNDVWRFVYERVGRRSDVADEVTSETFLAMVRQAETFDPQRASVTGWVFGIARHKLADHLRRVYRQRRHHLALQSLHPSADRVPTSDARLEHREQLAELNAALDELSAADRQVLLWRYADELSLKEIGLRLNRTAKACECLLYRARQRLRQALETCEVNHAR